LGLKESFQYWTARVLFREWG